MSFRLGPFVPKKNYLIDTFLLPVYLINPISHLKLLTISVFSQKIDIYSDSI